MVIRYRIDHIRAWYEHKQKQEALFLRYLEYYAIPEQYLKSSTVH